MNNKMKKEILITDIKGDRYRYTDAKIVVDGTCNLIRVTFKHDTDTLYFPIVNILNIGVREY